MKTERLSLLLSERLRETTTFPSTESLPSSPRPPPPPPPPPIFPPVPPYQPPPPPCSNSPPPYASHAFGDLTTTTTTTTSTTSSSTSSSRNNNNNSAPPPYSPLPRTLPHPPPRHRLQKTESLTMDPSDSREQNPNSPAGDYHPHSYSLIHSHHSLTFSFIHLLTHSIARPLLAASCSPL